MTVLSMCALFNTYLLISILFQLICVKASCNVCKYDNETECKLSRRLDQNVTEGADCNLVKVKKISDCKNVILNNDHNERTISKVKMKAFVDTSCRIHEIMSFNLTFPDTSWNYLRYKYEPLNGNDYFCEELQILLPIQISSTAQLYRDCFWIGRNYKDYEERDYQLTYEAGEHSSSKDSGKFLFKIPSVKTLNPETTALQDWKVFFYVDRSVKNHFKVMVQPAPAHFNVDKYIVTLRQNHSSEPVFEQQLTALPEQDQLSHEFRDHVSGHVFFTVQIKHEVCERYRCAISESPIIIIEDVPVAIIITLVSIVAVLILVLIACYYILKHYFTIEKPVVLIIYRPTFTSHVNVVMALAEHLNKFCQIEALVDVLEIPKSKEKDPFNWCVNAFDQAKRVMVLSSPPPVSSSGEGLHPNLDLVGLRLLSVNFSDCQSSQKFFHVLLPYCNESDLPKPRLKCFKLIDNWNEMLLYIHQGTANSWFSKIKFYVFKSQLPGSESDPLKYGDKLKAALSEAMESIKNAKITSSTFDMKLNVNKTEVLPNIPVNSRSLQTVIVPEHTFQTHRHKSLCFDEQMFPGNIQDLNLLGSNEAHEAEQVALLNQPQVASFNLDDIL